MRIALDAQALQESLAEHDLRLQLAGTRRREDHPGAVLIAVVEQFLQMLGGNGLSAREGGAHRLRPRPSAAAGCGSCR